MQRLKSLNLSQYEARIYLELLKEPSTHLKLARNTGINRSKVYRLVDQLEKRSLVSIRSDDKGSFLIASYPATLEVELVNQEEKLRNQRHAFVTLLPMLKSIRNNDPDSFIIHTYEGIEGFKQMLWHELKTKHELLVFGCGALSDLIGSDWEVYRNKIDEANYGLRIISNPNEVMGILNTKAEVVEQYIKKRYNIKEIPENVLRLDEQIAIYNNTVSIYSWKRERKVGIEIVNKSHANTVRQMFNHYWNIAETKFPTPNSHNK